MGSRILLADDSITIQKVVNLTFADEGIEVVAVSNGDLAERRLSDVRPDLVLADIFMPGKNGYELCEAIKQSPQFGNVPVVLLVGAFEPFDQAEARRVQADAHLTKPFESRTLVETVRRLISASPRTTTGPIVPTMQEGDRGAGVRTADPIISPPLATPPARLDLSAMSTDAPPSGPSVQGATGDIVAPAPYLIQGMSGDGAEVSAHETAIATLTEAPEHFEGMQPANAPAVDFDSQGPVLDFDSPESFGSPMPVLSFEHDESGSVDNVLSEIGGETEWFGLTSPATQRLDATSVEALWEPAATTPLSYPGPAPLEMPSVAEQVADAPENATILGGEEPLGDILQHETVSAEPVPFVDVLANDSLGFEIAETGDRSTSPSQFELLDGHPSSQVSLSADQQAQTVDFAEVNVGARIAEASDSPSSEQLPNDMAAESSMAVNNAENVDWTSPNVQVYSTAQLDSVEMPPARTESVPESTVDNGKQVESPDEPAFAVGRMSMEDEARFTPIDLDADAQGAGNGSNDVETGFAFSAVTTVEPGLQDRETVQQAASDGAAQPAGELSTAAIEEIVRRVVAKMSESVVREVAWEVVPDCVERVIDQLTRESLSKRM